MSNTETAIDHYEARCLLCDWTGPRRHRHAGAVDDASKHGKWGGCWEAEAYAIYEDGSVAEV